MKKTLLAVALLTIINAAQAEDRGPSLNDNKEAMHDCAYSATPVSDACMAVLAERIKIVERMQADMTEFCGKFPTQCDMRRRVVQNFYESISMNGHYTDYARIIAQRGFTAEAAMVRAKGKETAK